MTSPRFVAFISRTDEIDGYIGRQPNAAFVFASYSRLGPGIVTIDPARDQEMLATFSELHARHPFAGILNKREKYVIPAATLANGLGVRPILADPALARDKLRMRKALGGGASFPRCILVSSPADADSVPDDIFPCVFKPRFGFNSRAVCLANSREELRQGLAIQHEQYRSLPKQDGTNSDFLVEDFVSGTEHTVETLLKDGEPLIFLTSDKHPMRPPFFVEVGDLMPSALPIAVTEDLGAAAGEAARRLGIQNGWTHTEIRLHRGTPIVIECAARMGGGYFEQLIKTVYGIDRMQVLIDLHLDRPLPKQPEPCCHIAARRYVLDGVNQVYGLENGNELFSREGLSLIWPRVLDDIPRTVVGPPDDFNNTVFEFFARADSAQAATQIANCVIRTARVRRRPLANDAPCH